MSAAETVDEIHKQGAIALAPHPFNLVLGSKGLEAVGNLVNKLPFDAVETRNSNPLELFSIIWHRR
jgi:predicted metal-dependent phosphoesterase TrpH